MNATSGRVRATRVSCPEGRWQGARSNHVRASKRAGTASREEARRVGAGGFRSTGQGPEPGGKDNRSVISSSLSTIVGSSSNGDEWMSLPTSPKCTKLAPSQQQPCSGLGAARRARSCQGSRGGTACRLLPCFLASRRWCPIVLRPGPGHKVPDADSGPQAVRQPQLPVGRPWHA